MIRAAGFSIDASKTLTDSAFLLHLRRLHCLEFGSRALPGVSTSRDTLQFVRPHCEKATRLQSRDGRWYVSGVV